MNTIKKYAKNLAISFSLILLFSFFVNILNYFDLINQNIYKTIIIILTSISIFIGSFLLGKESNKKGYLEGLKFGTIAILIMLIISYLAFEPKISLSTIIYYLILIITSSIGSMFGINKKKEEKI